MSFSFKAKSISLLFFFTFVKSVDAQTFTLDNAFANNPLSQAVDNHDFDFLNATGNGFFNQSEIYNLDCDAAQSSPTPDDGSAIMFVEVAGRTEISFDWKVSSEANFDGLNFGVFSIDANGQLVDTGIGDFISGEVDWNRRFFQIPSGQHLAVWFYLKDSVDLDPVGQDAGWVDNVSIGRRGTITPDLNNEDTCNVVNTTAALPAIMSLLLNEDEFVPPPPPPPPPPPEETDGRTIPSLPINVDGQYIIRLESDQGDFIGQGIDYEYTQQNSNVDFGSNFDNGISISIDGNGSPGASQIDGWSWDMASRDNRLEVGVFENTERFPFGDINQLNFSGNGRGCNTSSGQFRIIEVAYDSADNLTRLLADFVQFCGSGGTSALRGSIDFDLSRAPAVLASNQAPVGNPVPALPITAATTVIELESDPGDFIGGGIDRSFSSANSGTDLSVRSNFNGSSISVGINTNTDFLTLDIERGSLDADPNRDGPLTVGVYENAFRFPFNDPLPGLDFSGNGRGCNTLTGRFRIFDIEIVNTQVTRLIADFEQHCEGGSSALRGSIRHIVP